MTEKEKQHLLRWNNGFTALRQINKLQQLFCFGIALGLQWNPDLSTWSLPVILGGSPDSDEVAALSSEAQNTIARTLVPVRQIFLLLFIVSISTLAEMVMWLGHMWIPKADRKLPYWPLALPIPGLGKFIGRRRWLNILLSLTTLALLAQLSYESGSVFFFLQSSDQSKLAPGSAFSLADMLVKRPMSGHNVWVAVLCGAFACFFVACSVDGWRLHYSHYWLAGLWAFVAPLLWELSGLRRGATWVQQGWDTYRVGMSDLELLSEIYKGLALIFGCLYTWTGFFKLTCPKFYGSTAQWVFGPVFALQRLVLTEKVCSDKTRRLIEYFESGASVLVEMVIGLSLLFATTQTQHDPDRGHRMSYLMLVHPLKLVCLLNVLMHLYICLFIGLRNQIETFVSWNAMCAAITAVVFVPPVGMATVQAGETAASGAGTRYLLDPMGLSWYHWALFLSMNVPPVLHLLGRTEHITLCHMWFVPGASGRNTLLFKYEAAGGLPESDNGVAVPIFRDNCFDRFVEVMGSVVAVADALELKIPAAVWQRHHKYLSKQSTDQLIQSFEAGAQGKGGGGGGGAAKGSPVWDYVKEHTVSMDGQWVDTTFRYHQNDKKLGQKRMDTCNENFGAGPIEFWKCLISEQLKVPTLRLVEYHEGVARTFGSNFVPGKRKSAQGWGRWLFSLCARGSTPRDVVDVIGAGGEHVHTVSKEYPQ